MQQQPEKIIVHVDPDLEELIPGYLSNRKKDIAAIRDALVNKDLDRIRIIGHSMKGSGRGYGFEAITEIGMLIEVAAKESRHEDIIPLITRLEDYLTRIEIVYE
jgi:HPt (histidine-containing phosphotransfer) domain-containing protein